ncbi:MAG: glycosyltransferase [Acidobacteriota bacterium]
MLYHHRTRAQDVEGVHIRGMVNAFRELGHTVDIVAPPGVTHEPRAPAAARASRWRAFARRAPESLFEAAEVAYNAYALPALERRLSVRDYSFVFERYALFLGAGVLAAARHRVPIILEVNDSARVDRIRAARWKRAGFEAERRIWRSASAIVTVSSVFRDIVADAGVPAERVHVIPNAVDAAAFSELPDGSATRRQLGLEGVVIGYVGALNSWRRLDLLLDVFARRRLAASLLVIGDGPDRAALERAADRRVRFVGNVPHADIPRYLACVDIAVIPHSNTYGSPMKLFEYMAAAKAVVVPALGPMTDVLTPAEGRLFAPLDADALGRALEELVADAGLRARLGRAARAKALREFVWRGHAERVLRLREAL